MKIVIPVDNKSLDSQVANTFGRAPFYLVYDIEGEKPSFVDNSAARSQGGAGIKAAQIVVDTGAKVLIAPQCGENAAKVIKAANIEIYKNETDSVSDTIRAFKEGKLSKLDDIHSGYHRRGD